MNLNIPVAGGTLHAQIQGTGTPILLWHSLLCHHQLWLNQVDVLASDYQVINLDMRGHGKSSLYNFPYDYWELSRDVGRVLDYLNLDKVIMMGLSMGGMAAYHVALDQPERLMGFIAISATADPDPWLARSRNRILAEVSLRIPPQTLTPLIDPLMLGQTTLAQRPEVVRQWHQQFATVRPQGIYHCVKALGRRENLLPHLPNVKIPALVMIGEEDKTLSIARGKVVAEALPHAQFQVIPQAGHLCVLEQPDLCNQAITRFLYRLESN